MIQLINLTKKYADKTAVSNVSFRVQPGLVTGFLGPNGAGKTTTIRMILGLAAPTAGSVTIDGKPYAALKAPLKKVGAMVDVGAIDSRLTPRQYLAILTTASGASATKRFDTEHYHKLRCAVAVSLEVDTMAMSAFEATLINNVVEAMTKAIEQAIISGNGTGKPKGVLAETPEDGQSIDSAAPSYKDLIDAEAALPQAYENGAVWCMSKKTFMQYYGLTDETGQPIGRVNYGIAGKPERSLLGRPVIVCDYVTFFAATMTAGTVFAFLFNFADYVLNTNYAMGIKKYEDNDTDDLVTKAIMLVDGKTVDKNSLVVIKKKA